MHSVRIRSFVGRNGRKTEGQTRALLESWPKYGLSLQKEPSDFRETFGKVAPCYLEIGFGTGQSLVSVAKSMPNAHFIGIETHQPGIGALLIGLETHQLTNVRVFNNDSVDVLETCIAPNSLQGINIFFPDPWPKRKHHERRLIQTHFLQLVLSRLKPKGTLHLATDWEHYATHMMRTLTAIEGLENIAGHEQFATRSIYRPILTKFEKRAIRDGRHIWELQFIKKTLDC